MNLYLYKSIDKNGNIIKDKIKAINKKEVVDYLKQKDYYIINIKKFNLLNKDIKDIINIKRNKISKKDIAVFCRNMSFALGSGLPITISIDTIIKQCESFILKKELIKIKENLLKGESFSKSMIISNKFSNLLCNMVKVGEESGDLTEIMKIMADYYDESWKIRENIKIAMLYPILIIISMMCVIIISITFVIPNYLDIFINQGYKLPILTKILINISNFLLSYYLFLLLLLIILILFFKITWNKYYIKKFRDFLLLKIPYINKLYIKLLNLRFSQSMNIMLKSGVPILKSISITKEIMNNTISDKVMDKLYNDLKKGKSLVDSIKNSKIFTPIILNILSIGENTGNLVDCLYKIYEYFNFEIKKDINMLEKLIEPILVIVLGLVLSFIMIAIMLPIFNITNYI